MSCLILLHCWCAKEDLHRKRSLGMKAEVLPSRGMTGCPLLLISSALWCSCCCRCCCCFAFGCLLLLLLVTVVAVLLLVVAIVAVAIAAVADVFSKVSAQSCATADTIVHMFWFPILVSTANDQEWTMIFMLLPSHKSIIEKRYQKTWFVCRVDHLPPWKIISKYTLKK